MKDETQTMPKRPRSMYQLLMELITSSNCLILTTFPAQLDTKNKINASLLFKHFKLA
jgi:hypothetical protein